MQRVTLILILTAGFMCLLPSAAHADCEQLFKLLAVDGEELDDFGWSVAIDGTIAVVGSKLDGDNGFRSGSAYVFDTATGRQVAKLLPEDGAEGDFFGVSVGISGTTAIVGAHFDDDNGDNSGSAFLFDVTTGRQIAKLLPDDGERRTWFGHSVAISGSVAIVGAKGDDVFGDWSGSAYLFDTVTGQQLAKLVPDDGAAHDFFGRSVAISGTTAIVGADEDDDNGEDSGSAYLFDISDPMNPAQVAKLLPSDGAADDGFGFSVAIDGTIAIVGSPTDDDNGSASGSTYLFDTGLGQQVAKLLPDDGAEFDFFGISVAIDGTTAIVGAFRGDANGTNSGSAYLFDIATVQQIAKLLPHDGAQWDEFGYTVAISETTAFVGAYANDDYGDNTGSAYLFNTVGCESWVRDPEWICDGDVDGDGRVNPVDAGIVQAHFGSEQQNELCNYDIDCDGQINPVDSGIVQSLFGTCEAPRDSCR